MVENILAITTASDQSTFSGETTTPISILSKSLLELLSEVITIIQYIDREQDTFLQIGCYLYRLTPIISELKKIEDAPTNAMETLQSLYNTAQFAKDVLYKVREGTEAIPGHELSLIMTQLEDTIRNMGEELSLVPTSAFPDQPYAEITLRSLSEEMKKVQFKTLPSYQLNPNTELVESRTLQEKSDCASSMPPQSNLGSTRREACFGNFSSSNTSRSVQVLKSLSMLSKSSTEAMSPGAIRSMQEAAQYVEPLFQSFFCPLTQEVMDDPVTVQSGMTYEREAITAWFEKFSDSEEVTCPKTGERFQSRAQNPNLALKATIEEWKDRNDMAMIKMICSTLSTGNSENIIEEALRDLLNICIRRPEKIRAIRTMGIMPLIAKHLELRDRKVRHHSLEVLRLFANDDECKELIGKTRAVTSTIQMLSSGHQPIRHAALSLLVELSKSKSISEKIGSITGAILLLIKMKYNASVDQFASELAADVLKNLTQSLYNIKCMAENGFLNPLLDNLIEGPDEIKRETASCLGELVLGHEDNCYVVQRASPALIQMLQSGDTLNRRSAFRAVAKLSSYIPSGRLLVEAGFVEIIVEELLTPKCSLKEAAMILANILDSGFEIDKLGVSPQGCTMDSEYLMLRTIHLIMNSKSDDVNLSLIKILLSLAKYPKSEAALVSAVREKEARYLLSRFVKHPNDELAIGALKLLRTLSTHTGHTLVDIICTTDGQPEGLIDIPSSLVHVTERHALSTKFVAELPHQSLELNLALLTRNVVPEILQAILQILGSGMRPNKYTNLFLEGLVGILVRFTATIYERQVLSVVINYNFTKVFSNLLTETSSGEVKRSAAVGLEKLSAQSINLSKPQKEEIKTSCCLSLRSEKRKEPICPIHEGVCSSRNTFCLVDAGALNGLLACLNHMNADLVEAALLALATLLDGNLNMNKSVSILDEMNAMAHIVKVVREHKKESLLQKVFWITERFLSQNSQKTVSVVLQDRVFSATVVTAFHHGEPYTRQMAEKILTYLNKMPTHTTTFTTTFTV